MPIHYPTSIDGIEDYRFPIITVSRHTENNEFDIECSILISKTRSGAADSDTYTDRGNPITCRYWYFD